MLVRQSVIISNDNKPSWLKSMMLYFQGFNELEKALKDNNICIAWTDKLLKDSGVATEESYLSIVDELKKRPNARGQYDMSIFPVSVLLIFITSDCY